MTDKKELILVNPPVGNWLIRWVFFLFAKNTPCCLLTLSALTPPEYKIKIFNQKILWRKKDFTGKALVGITCVTSSAPQAYALARRFRQAGSRVVMGGPHVSALPQEALDHCDSVVIGEAESVWGQVVKDFENGTLSRIYKGEPVKDFFSLVFNYYMGLPPSILKNLKVMVSRGCRYRCEFCVPSLSPLRYASIEQVVALVEKMKKASRPSFWDEPGPAFIAFEDDNTFSDPVYAKKLFKALTPLKIHWGSQSSINIAFDEEALSLARESGCRQLFIGLETIYPQQFPKTSVGNIVSTGDYIKAIKKIRSYGIKVIGAFMVGFDEYSHRDYWRLLLFLVRTFIESRFSWVVIAIVTPFPGTPLFERLKKEGRIKTYDWRKYDLCSNVVFRLKTMSSFSLMAWFVILRVVAVLCSAYGLFVVLVGFFPTLVFWIAKGLLFVKH